MNTVDAALIVQVLMELLVKAQNAASLLQKDVVTEEDVDASGLSADVALAKLKESSGA